MMCYTIEEIKDKTIPIAKKHGMYCKNGWNKIQKKTVVWIIQITVFFDFKTVGKMMRMSYFLYCKNRIHTIIHS